MKAATVRPFRQGDAEALIALAREMAADLRDPPPALTPILIDDALAGPDPWCRVLVAERAGRLVGYAATCRRFEPHTGQKSLWLADLHVAATERRRSTGRLLMTAVAREAREAGCSRLVWDLWVENAGGRAFYRELGARRDEAVEVWVLEVGDEA